MDGPTTNSPSESPTGEASQEIVEMFAEEALAQLDTLERILLDLGKDCSDGVLNEAFRAMHSLKGNAGCLGLLDIEAVAHRAEDILDGLRNHAFPSSQRLISSLLAAVDAIRGAVGNFEGGGLVTSRAAVVSQLEDVLARAQNHSHGEATSDDQPCPAPTPRLGELLVAQGAVDETRVREVLDFQRRPLGELLINLGLADEEAIQLALAEQQRLAIAHRPEPVKAAQAELPAPARGEAAAPPRPESSFVRVDTHKLDALLGQVGELISAASAVAQLSELGDIDRERFAITTGQLMRVTSGLHDAAMSMRMVPLAGLVTKLNRAIRDLQIKLGKQVQFTTAGENTDVDKSVLEGIADPLLHILRNSIDHGLENPQARVGAGKNPVGKVHLEARHQGGEVWITVSDDGRGIDPARIRAKAESLGWIEPQQPISDAALLQMIFRPGFSTAEQVTGVSGRGVGMDVVKHNIEALRGRVELASVPGKGTSVSIRLPLTLAILDVMLVRVADCLFGLPVLSLRESVSVPPSAMTRLPDGTELVRIRDRMVPVIGLDEAFGLAPPRPPCEGLVALVEHGDAVVGLRVDHLLGQRQLVIKPLDSYLAQVRGISGCAVLGAGEICLLVDIAQFLETHGQAQREAA